MQRRIPTLTTKQPFRIILDARLLLRWIYIVRWSVASALLVAAIVGLAQASGIDAAADLAAGYTPLRINFGIAVASFAVTTIFTVLSAGYSDVYRRPLSVTFRYLQSLFDLVLVTVSVHLTTQVQPGAANDADERIFYANPGPLSALYILVIASASLLLPRGGSLYIAALGNVMYVADVYFFGATPTQAYWIQLTVFAVVALGTAYVSEELRRSGEWSDKLRVEHARVALRAEEVLRNIRSGVVTIDDEGRLAYANPMADRLLGLDLSDSVGSPILERISSRAPMLAEALDRAVRERVRTQRGEGTVVAGPRQYPIGVTTTYMEDESTGLRTAIAIFQDISDTKRMDALRLRAERLEGIAELSASLAHEIKNPLASIRSSVEQLSRMPRTTPDERTLADLVMRESDRLSRLLSEFLDFTRVRVSHPHPVDLGEIVRGAARLAGAHPDKRDGVVVRCVIPDDVPFVVTGDEDLLHRAIFNLALNGVQAAPGDSEVTIDVIPDPPEAAHMELAVPQGLIGVRVTDRGSGIATDIRDRLFDPFFTTKPNGSGLGLAVVHRAIEAHRGVVLVDSGEGGTRFTVLLPRMQGAAMIHAEAFA